MYLDIIMLARKKQNIDPMWKVLNNQVHLGDSALFLDHVYLECTQIQCETSKVFIDNYRTMFESRISAESLIGRLDLKHRLSVQYRSQSQDGFHDDLRSDGQLPGKSITECFRADPVSKIQKQQS